MACKGAVQRRYHARFPRWVCFFAAVLVCSCHACHQVISGFLLSFVLPSSLLYLIHLIVNIEKNLLVEDTALIFISTQTTHAVFTRDQLQRHRNSFSATQGLTEEFIMAVRSLYTLLALALSFNVIALQVTPNSPCSSACLDSSTLDRSDPNSSNTESTDIVCEDLALNGTSTGSKWKQCMTCLQNSTFEQGPESDQYWFMCESSSILGQSKSNVKCF